MLSGELWEQIFANDHSAGSGCQVKETPHDPYRSGCSANK